ncbi:MAG: acyl-CoA desaturase [Bacteroidia bacterium]|nr:acyl-CoA desaturase [Bacteroidia bacterium]
MIIIIFFIVHWYVSLFFQSFFNHRYAAHGMFTMSKGWEKVFYILSWLTNGSSFLSPNTYGILHRMHHAFADKEKDPHSPKFSPNPFALMLKTRNIYSDIWHRRIPLEKRFTDGVPYWKFMDVFGESNGSRLFWVVAYTAFYIAFATAWWQFLFLPLTIVIGPFHGVVINWFAHKIGYSNFKVSDTSKNFLPVDVLMLGESYHNNHHKRPNNPNFGFRWFEMDPIYPFILLFNALGIIKLKKAGEATSVDFELSEVEVAQLKAEFANLQSARTSLQLRPETKFRQYLEAWDSFVKQDWQGDMNEYLRNLQVRKEIEEFLQTTNENLREKLKSFVEPLDQKFREKMVPWKKEMMEKLNFSMPSPHFWESNSIYQVG